MKWEKVIYPIILSLVWTELYITPPLHHNKSRLNNTNVIFGIILAFFSNDAHCTQNLNTWIASFNNLVFLKVYCFYFSPVFTTPLLPVPDDVHSEYTYNLQDPGSSFTIMFLIKIFFNLSNICRNYKLTFLLKLNRKI